MELTENQNMQMEFNDSNYKAEWVIPNFIFALKDGCQSPIFYCDDFKVKFYIHDSSNLEFAITFIPISNKGLFLDYSIIINNIDNQKSEIIKCNVNINGEEKKCSVFSKIKSSDINSQNGFLQENFLRITCIFHLNDNAQDQSNISTEVQQQTDWYINEDISDFHSTEEPFNLIIKDNTLHFALTFEITEDGTYLFSIYLIDPDFSFKGQLTVILHNQISTEKDITKITSIQFTPDEFDLQPISFDLTQGQLTNQQNGWLIYDKETNSIISGLHFTIIFYPPDKILNIFSQFEIETKKELFDRYPVNLPYDEQLKAYTFTLSFDPSMYNLYKCERTNLIQAGGLIFYCKVNFQSETFSFTIYESLFEEGKGIAFTFYTNNNSPDLILKKKKFIFDKTNRTVELKIPFSINDILDYSKGWLVNNSVSIEFGVHCDNLNVTSLYPIKLTKSIINNGFYGIKYFIPLSLFSSNSQQHSSCNITNQISMNSIYTNSFSVTPVISFYKEEYEIINWDEFLLKLKTRLNFNYFKKDDVIFDILVTFVNKDKEKNFSSFFTGVSQVNSINLQDFNLNKPIKEEGFVHNFNSKEFIEIDIKIRIYNDNFNELQKNEESQIILNLCKNYSENQILHYFYSASNDDFLDHPTYDFDEEGEKFNKESSDFVDNNNNSKKETGYVGLRNQGATCYLNSFLQTLFHLPAFRRLIYEIPTTGNEDPNTSIPLNIQRLFYQLQFSDKSCSTVNLTKSFGWNSNDSFRQHDIEEFSRVLIDNLEKKMKGTNLQDSIPHLFRGRFRNYIKCTNVNYTTFKEESFYDLSMDVKGISNLNESFKSYIKPDELIGDNQYNTEEFGKQDAIMGTEFLEFPPVLHIHLRRFMFDITSITGMTKINDRFEFPETIDLSEYLADDSLQKKLSNIYDLYGVLVHSGSHSSGHYYAFLRTSTDKQWYKFNDSFVSKDSVDNAVFNNFGGNGHSYSGYLLIYVRRENAKELFEPINDNSVPEHLKIFEEKIHKKEKNIKVYFIHENYLKSNAADKILRFFRNDEFENEENLSEYEMHMEEYERSTTTSELYALLSSFYCLDESQFRLWICYYQKVPRKVILSSDTTTLDELTKGRNKLYVFVQPIKEDDNFNFRKEIMIYINFFFSKNLLNLQSFEKEEDDRILKNQLKAPLQYLLSLPVSKDVTISSIISIINKKLNFEPSTELECFHVPLNNNLQKLKSDSSIQFILNEYGIGNGSIFIFQMKQESIDKISKGSLKLNFEFQSPTENLKRIDNSLNLYSENDFDETKKELKSIENYLSEFAIAEVYNYNNQTSPLFYFEFSTNIKIFNLKKFIIQAAIENKNINKIDENEYNKITLLNLYKDRISKLDNNDNLKYIVNNNEIMKFYLSIPSLDFKQKEIKVQFSSDSKIINIEKVIQLKNCLTFDDVFKAFKSSLSENEKELFIENCCFRYLLIRNDKIDRILNDFDFLSDLRINDVMRIEIIPKNQVNLRFVYLLLKCFYLNVDFIKNSMFGQPFLFDVKEGEKFSETKKRLVNYMNLPDGESVNNFNFYLEFVNKKFLDFAVLKFSNKVNNLNEYLVVEKNGSEFIKLNDSSLISDFIQRGSFMLQLAIVSDKIDELKNDFEDDSKISKISVESTINEDDLNNGNSSIHSSNHHNDLRIYN